MPQQVKKLDEANLKKVRELETKLGVCIVAYEPPPGPARLSEGELQQLKEAERELGSVLVAYKCE